MGVEEVLFSLLIVFIGAALEAGITYFLLKYFQKQERQSQNVSIGA
jgi:hypothetical protein